jgi:hypothetical protein
LGLQAAEVSTTPGPPNLSVISTARVHCSFRSQQPLRLLPTGTALIALAGHGTSTTLVPLLGLAAFAWWIQGAAPVRPGVLLGSTCKPHPEGWRNSRNKSSDHDADIQQILRPRLDHNMLKKQGKNQDEKGTAFALSSIYRSVTRGKQYSSAEKAARLFSFHLDCPCSTPTGRCQDCEASCKHHVSLDALLSLVRLSKSQEISQQTRGSPSSQYGPHSWPWNHLWLMLCSFTNETRRTQPLSPVWPALCWDGSASPMPCGTLCMKNGS